MCVSPGELHRCSNAADEYPNAETASSDELPLFSVHARDLAFELDTRQGSNCEVRDSGE